MRWLSATVVAVFFEKVFYLMAITWFDTMTDTVLAAVALFTFMGYILEKAGLMAAPVMARSNYDSGLSAGAITAGGTLGILIPPSIMLVVMGPVMQVSVGRLFAAALLPGLMLAGLYVLYTIIRVMINPVLGPPLPDEELDVTTGYKVRDFFWGSCRRLSSFWQRWAPL